MQFGVDIVDLLQTDAHHPRFAQRVFCPEEEDWLLANAEDPSLRWAFWAIKEAGFKALGPVIGVAFHPKEWRVDWQGQVVHFRDHLLFARVNRDVEHVRAACASQPTFQLWESLSRESSEPSPQEQSLKGRRLLEKLCDEEQFASYLTQRSGRPFLNHPNACVSLSHHGRYTYAGLAEARDRPRASL